MNAYNLRNDLKYEFGATKIICKVSYMPYKTVANLYFSISDECFKKFLDNQVYYKNSFDYFEIEKHARVHIYCTKTNIV